MSVRVIMAREEIPEGPSVFLAGPTPTAGTIPSWRLDAVEALDFQWNDPEPLTILSPESRGGKRAREYGDQVRWEMKARFKADAILFWIPRDMALLPGMTTNVEFGYDVARQRNVVLGCPPDCPNPERNRYLIFVAHQAGVPVRTTLSATVSAALTLAGYEPGVDTRGE